MSENKKRKKIWYLLLRYLILILLGISLPLFYKIFLPLTIFPASLLLSLFYEVFTLGNIIFVAGTKIEIINACVAGSAYYLLLILNLTTDMKAKKRFFSILFSLLALLILNLLRILILSIFYLKNLPFFDFSHTLSWYVLSIAFVVGIWFLTVWLFKIKNIPVYSDIKFLKKKT